MLFPQHSLLLPYARHVSLKFRISLAVPLVHLSKLFCYLQAPCGCSYTSCWALRCLQCALVQKRAFAVSAMLRIRNVESCVATPCGLVGCSDVSEYHTTSVFRVDVKGATLHISKLKFGSIQYIFKKKNQSAVSVLRQGTISTKGYFLKPSMNQPVASRIKSLGLKLDF